MAKRKPKIKFVGDMGDITLTKKETAKAMEAEGAQEASDEFVGDRGDITLNRVGKSFTVPFREIKKTGKTLLDKLRDRGPLYKK